MARRRGPHERRGTTGLAHIRWQVTAIAGAVLVAAALGVLAGTRAAPPGERRVLAVDLGLSPDASTNQMAITPDGSRVIFVGGSGARLMARSLDALEAVELARGSSISSPFVSPDGRWVGYVDAANRLMKVPALGGRASTVATLDGRVSGATWLDEHTIIASTLASTGLLRVSADGSASPVAITAPDQGLDHVLPQRLPEGRSVLFGVISRDEPQYGVHRLQKLDVTTGSSPRSWTVAARTPTPAPSGRDTSRIWTTTAC